VPSKAEKLTVTETVRMTEALYLRLVEGAEATNLKRGEIIRQIIILNLDDYLERAIADQAEKSKALQLRLAGKRHRKI
jgi:hypothetical protein